jgi:Flp pilus assembly pilin Flp
MHLKNSGQALIEYLILFSFMALIAINMVKGMGGMLTSSIGTIGQQLTQQLTIGVCEKECWYSEYENRTK